MPISNINGDTKKLLEEFCEKYIYPRILDKDNLLAVLTYGSSATGFSSKNSDVDLLIIVNRADNTTRGVKFYKGKKIEYFIKPIEKFLSEGVKYTKENCPSHVALEQNAYFLYDRDDFIANMLKADRQFYNQNHEKLNQNYDLKFVQISNRIASLKNIYERGGKEFAMVYFNIVEMIRAFHSSNFGEAEVPFSKAYRVYTDPKYYDKFVSNNSDNPLPDAQFVKLYTKCVEETSDQQKMIENIDKLFEYEKQFVKIDPENYEINLE